MTLTSPSLLDSSLDSDDLDRANDVTDVDRDDGRARRDLRSSVSVDVVEEVAVEEDRELKERGLWLWAWIVLVLKWWRECSGRGCRFRAVRNFLRRRPSRARKERATMWSMSSCHASLARSCSLPHADKRACRS